MNSSDQQRQLTLSNSDIKQDIDSSYALGTILLKQTVIKHFVQGQISGKGPTPLSDSWSQFHLQNRHLTLSEFGINQENGQFCC